MNRRIFIRNTVLGTSGVAVGASAGMLSSCAGRKSKEQLIVALIGCGARGTELALKACQPGMNVRIKYVCDVNAGKSKLAADQLQKALGYLPLQTWKFQSVLDDKEVDAVLIATPDHWHALATIKTCQAGKDVYVEATPSLNIWEGQKMQEAARRYTRVVQVGFQHRSAGYVSAARNYIKSGKLGQVVHVKTYAMSSGSAWQADRVSSVPEGLDWNAWLGPAAERECSAGIYDISTRGGWTNYWAYSGGHLSKRASHVLDIARVVMGDPGHPQSVYCYGGNHCWGSKQEVPEMQEITYDFGKFTMTCETGNSMSYMKNKIEGTNNYPDWMRSSERVEIYGTKGLMYVGLDGRGWQVIGKGEAVLAGETGTDPLEGHLQNFFSCARSGKEPAADMKQGHLSATLVHLGNIAYRVGNQQLLFDGVKEVFAGNNAANELIKSSYRQGYTIPEKV